MSLLILRLLLSPRVLCGFAEATHERIESISSELEQCPVGDDHTADVLDDLYLFQVVHFQRGSGLAEVNNHVGEAHDRT